MKKKAQPQRVNNVSLFRFESEKMKDAARTVSEANTTVTIAVPRLIVRVMILFASASATRATSLVGFAAGFLMSSSSTLGTTSRSETTSIVASPEASWIITTVGKKGKKRNKGAQLVSLTHERQSSMKNILTARLFKAHLEAVK